MKDDKNSPDYEDKDVPPGGNQFPNRSPKTSACIVLGGTLTAFFALQGMAMYYSEEVRQGYIDALTPDWIFGEMDTIGEQKQRRIQERFKSPRP